MMGLDELAAYADVTGMTLLAALAALGLLVGILSGLFGVGGGFLMVPLLSMLVGMDYSLAVGSGLAATIGTGTAGLARHRRLENVELRTAIAMAAGSVVGVVLGDMLHQCLRASLAGPRGQLAPFDRTMDAIFIAMLSVTAWVAWRGPRAHHSGRTPLQRLAVGPHIDLPQAGLKGVSLPGLCVVGLGVGVLTGLLGVGGGVLFVPVLLSLVGLSAHQAVGTSLGVVLVASIAGTVKKGLDEGQISLLVAMALLVGSTVGVQIGAAVCDRLHATKLRRYFALLVVLVIVMLAARFIIRIT